MFMIWDGCRFVLQHIGPAIPEVSSIWFKLYLYHVAGQGPPSLLLSKGSRLRKLPEIFQVGSIQVNKQWGYHLVTVITQEWIIFQKQHVLKWL